MIRIYNHNIKNKYDKNFFFQDQNMIFMKKIRRWQRIVRMTAQNKLTDFEGKKKLA